MSQYTTEDFESLITDDIVVGFGSRQTRYGLLTGIGREIARAFAASRGLIDDQSYKELASRYFPDGNNSQYILQNRENARHLLEIVSKNYQNPNGDEKIYSRLREVVCSSELGGDYKTAQEISIRLSIMSSGSTKQHWKQRSFVYRKLSELFE